MIKRERKFSFKVTRQCVSLHYSSSVMYICTLFLSGHKILRFLSSFIQAKGVLYQPMPEK
jgi:hypothetical protein